MHGFCYKISDHTNTYSASFSYCTLTLISLSYTMHLAMYYGVAISSVITPIVHHSHTAMLILISRTIAMKHCSPWSSDHMCFISSH